MSEQEIQDISENQKIDQGNRGVTVIAKEGKYLTFELGDEDYGLEILKVREIIGIMDITPVPQVPEYVKGVINLRGKVIPVIDLRFKFGMEKTKQTAETCIIVVNIEAILIGVMIDRVKEVLDISQKDIEPSPRLGSSINTEYILGIGKVNNTVKILLNIDVILGEGLSLDANN